MNSMGSAVVLEDRPGEGEVVAKATRRGFRMMPDYGSGRGVDNRLGAAAWVDDGETARINGVGILIRHGCTIPKTGPHT